MLENVGIYLFDDAELLDFAGPYEVFSSASQLSGGEAFNVFTVSEKGGEIRTVNGLAVVSDYSFRGHPDIDILLIPGGDGTKAEIRKQNVMEWIDGTQMSAKIMATVCSGARIPAALGLLDGLTATTHRLVIDDVQKLAPRAVIDHTLRFVDNGKIITSGGISAGTDMALHIVERLYGRDLAVRVMEYMEYSGSCC